MFSIVITAVLTALTGITVAGCTYWFTKQREREAELRKEKLQHYKEFATCLSGIIEGESTADGQRGYALAHNKLLLVAPQPVIDALRAFQEEIRISNPNKSKKRHDDLLSRLFYEIRHDLRISPRDRETTFQVALVSSGVRPNRS